MDILSVSLGFLKGNISQAIVAARSTRALRRLLESLVKEGRALNGSLTASYPVLSGDKRRLKSVGSASLAFLDVLFPLSIVGEEYKCFWYLDRFQFEEVRCRLHPLLNTPHARSEFGHDFSQSSESAGRGQRDAICRSLVVLSECAACCLD